MTSLRGTHESIADSILKGINGALCGKCTTVNYVGRHYELDLTHAQEEEIYVLHKRNGKSPPLDDKVFKVSESILWHPLAIPTHQYLQIIINPRKVSGGGNREDMGEVEGHKLAPGIPPNRDKEEKPPEKLARDVASIIQRGCRGHRR